MPDSNKPVLQHLTASLAGFARQLLRQCKHTQEQHDRPAADAGITHQLAEEGIAMNSSRQSFSTVMFAELLMELPGYQGKISQAYQAGDRQGLMDHVHQLLGAVAYCDEPELETALRTLHRVLMTEDTDNIDTCYTRAFSAINSTLTYSGYCGSA
jgi:HPt (histidine-containing phosphotransfer) domain-containing protein